MTDKPIANLLIRCVVTIALVVLGSWLLYHNWQLRRIRYENYSFTAEEAKKLRNFSDAQFAYGMLAWTRGDAQKASEFFRQAVSEDPLYMDAWLRLAESEADLGYSGLFGKVTQDSKVRRRYGIRGVSLAMAPDAPGAGPGYG
jgi:tetratricopeptide (TPR) repeat protein